MAFQSGDFSESQLTTSLVTADRMFADPLRKADFEANIDLFKTIKTEQSANVDILQESEKDRDVKIYWATMCGEEAVDCVDNGTGDDDCDLAGNELGSDSKTYSLTKCKKWKFSVDEHKFRTNNLPMEEVVAKGFLMGDKILSEAVAATGKARIESFKGTNVVTNGVGTPNATTSETDIAANDWNERTFAYLYRVAKLNGFNNPFLLSGNNMFEERLITMLSQANAEGKGAAALYKLMRTYFDLVNIDSGTTEKTYMINRGAIAFASKVYYGATPVKYKTQDRYSIASRNMDGHRIDVYYTNRCEGSKIMHDFQMKIKYDYFLNPTGCDAGKTGVLAFNKLNA